MILTAEEEHSNTPEGQNHVNRKFVMEQLVD